MVNIVRLIAVLYIIFAIFKSIYYALFLYLY